MTYYSSLGTVPAHPLRELRKCQITSIEALRNSLRKGKKRPMLQLPTAAGKTTLAANITRMALQKRDLQDLSKRKPVAVYYVVPRTSLVGQTGKRFKEEGIPDIGLLGGGYKQNLNGQVIISTWQSLKNRMPLKPADLVIIDEAHSLPKCVRKWMEDPAWQKTPFIGLSATPWTKGLAQFFDDLIVGATIKELIEEGVLSPSHTFAPASHLKPDLKGVKIIAGEYHEGMLSERMQKRELVADAVEEWLARGENRPTILFAVDRAHAKKLRDEFDKAGVRTAYIDMHVTVAERDAIGEQLRTGEVQVVCSVDCLTMGIDWPWISCISLCRPTRNPWTFVQLVGRGLRTYPSKNGCRILDHSDTTARLGLVEDIDIHQLDQGLPNEARKRKRKEIERKEALPEECLHCGYMKPIGVRKCPDCGFEPQKLSPIGFREGELTEVGKKAEIAPAVKQSWYSMLLSIAYERQGVMKKLGWAAQKFKEKFGSWPEGLAQSLLEPIQEVRNFVKSRDIAWARGVHA